VHRHCNAGKGLDSLDGKKMTKNNSMTKDEPKRRGGRESRSEGARHDAAFLAFVIRAEKGKGRKEETNKSVVELGNPSHVPHANASAQARI